MSTLPVMDSLIGVFFTFMLGFSMNFVQQAIGSSEARDILVRRYVHCWRSCNGS